jgi:hypothetical protein
VDQEVLAAEVKRRDERLKSGPVMLQRHPPPHIPASLWGLCLIADALRRQPADRAGAALCLPVIPAASRSSVLNELIMQITVNIEPPASPKQAVASLNGSAHKQAPASPKNGKKKASRKSKKRKRKSEKLASASAALLASPRVRTMRLEFSAPFSQKISVFASQAPDVVQLSPIAS